MDTTAVGLLALLGILLLCRWLRHSQRNEGSDCSEYELDKKYGTHRNQRTED
jgi:hypothetical protein